MLNTKSSKTKNVSRYSPGSPWKKFIVFISIAYFAINVPFQLKAQIDIQLNPALYENGYNVACNGGTNGSIEAIPLRGTAPYAFLWSNGATTQNLSNVPAGIYTITVTDWDNHSAQKNIELSQPAALEINLIAYEYGGGTNISSQGASDGQIRSEIGGGAPPYTYLWSNASEGTQVDAVPAGAYTLTVTDVNGCSSSNSVTLTEPSELHIVSITSPLHHGYNISCRGGADGVINLSVTGGIPPYSYRWNNGSMSQNPGADLIAKLYMVIIQDANRAEVVGQITLTQPQALNVQLTPYVYGNGFNLSGYGSSNGSISANVTGGVSPYSYHWEPVTQTTANISNLPSGIYYLVVTDANGCTTLNNKTLTQPEQDVWSRGGNANTNPANQFIGTTDAQDVSFRTNNLERFRIKANGDLKINSFAGGTGSKLLLSDNLGNISSTKVIIPNQSCFTAPPVLAWTEGDVPSSEIGNCYYHVGIGTTNPQSWLEVAGAIRASANGTTHILDYINIQHDGGTASITSHGSGTLDINCGIGKDVKICAGSGSGNVEMGGNVYMSVANNDQVGIGTPNPENGYKLDVAGNAKFNQVKISSFSNTDPQNEIVAIDQDGIFSHTNLNTSILGLWQHANTPDDVLTSNGNTSFHIRNNANKNSSFWAVNDEYAYGFGIEKNDGTNNIGHIYKNINGPESILSFNNYGNVGIGTSTPSEKLEVDGSITTNSHPIYLKGAGDHNHGLGYYTSYGSSSIDGPVLFGFAGGALGTNQSGAENIALNWTSTGQVGIAGAICQDYMLAVHGKIITEEVVVKPQSNWPDYVFKSDYDLKSLQQLNEYIKKNKHLPGIPSEKDIESSGIGIGEIVGKQMQKIEELTLYVIQLKTEVDDLKKENAEIKLKVNNK